MDEVGMTPTLLIVGDSFMQADPAYPGQHWSEMMLEYNVINLAKSGNSLSLIQLSLYQGLAQHRPQAVMLGLTDPLRIDFSNNEDYYTNCHVQRLTSDQKTAAKYFQVTTDVALQGIKGLMQILSMLDLLQKHCVKYAFSLSLFEEFMKQTTIPDFLRQEFVRHQSYQVDVNLNHYQHQTHTPTYHVDSLDWQRRFAQSVQKILKEWH